MNRSTSKSMAPQYCLFRCFQPSACLLPSKKISLSTLASDWFLLSPTKIQTQSVSSRYRKSEISVRENAVIGSFRLLKETTNTLHSFYINKPQQTPRLLSTRRRLKLRTVSEPTELAQKFKMEWPKITLFGDSITRRSVDVDNGCWGSMIHYRVGNFFDVDERGFEGYNSRWGLDLMPKLFPRSYLEKVEIFVLFLGHNDSLEYNNFPAHVPVDEFDTNMRAIVKYLLENGLQAKNILLITPTWYYLKEFEKFLNSISTPLTGKDFEKAKVYADKVLAIAKDFNVDCLDFFDISSKYQPLEKLFCDGIHLSREGARLLFDNIMPLLDRKIETNLGKPLADLFHVTPFEMRPEVKPLLDAHRKIK